MKELGLGLTGGSPPHGGRRCAAERGLAAAQKDAVQIPAPAPPNINLGWQPVVDGSVLPETPFETTAPALSADTPFYVLVIRSTSS